MHISILTGHKVIVTFVTVENFVDDGVVQFFESATLGLADQVSMNDHVHLLRTKRINYHFFVLDEGARLFSVEGVLGGSGHGSENN